MSRPVGNSGYLVGRDSPDDLQKMDEAYCLRVVRSSDSTLVPNLFYKLAAASWPSLWGEFDVETNAFRHLGARGRIWALTLLLATYGLVPRTQSDSAQEIVNSFDVEAESVVHLKDKLKEKKKKPQIKTPLQSLISPTRRDGFPPADLSAALLGLMEEFATLHLFGPPEEAADPEPRRRFHEALYGDASRPSEVYKRLREVAAEFSKEEYVERQRRYIQGRGYRKGDDRRQSKAALSRIDKAIDHKLIAGANRIMPPDDEDLADPSVKKINDALKGSKRLIIVSGEPLLGKKTKVKGVLRMLAGNTGELLLPVRNPDDTLIDYLPVLVLSAGAQSYRALLDKVTEFLTDYQRVQTGQPPKARLRGWRSAHFDEAVEDLFAEYSSFPALFVIADVEAFEFDLTRQTIRDTGIRRLIEALLAGNRDSRVLITTDEITEDQAVKSLAHRNCDIISVPPPTTADLKMFVAAKSFDRLPEVLVDSNSEIRGDDLVTLSALASLSYDPSEPRLRLSEEELREVQMFLAQKRTERDQERRPVYRALVARIERWGLLHPLALIAASHDGVRDDSLERAFQRWAPFDQEVQDGVQGLDERLRAFREVAGDRFLRRSRLPRFDPDEYSPAESSSEEDQVWDMDPSVAYWFLKILNESRPDIVAASHRLIAGIARERAQNKKLRMRGPSGSRVTEDASRDVQAYTSLLASIFVRPDEHYEIAGPPLRTCEDDMFSLDPDRFKPARALRFAAYALLREDIDHDHRLSMLFDEDSLRLDLYLLLFLETGRQHPTKLGPLTAPDQLPSHMRTNIFRHGEVLDLMSTAALSAYHSQRFDVLKGLVRLAENYLTNHEDVLTDQEGDPTDQEDEHLPVRLSRLWCSEIDAYILLGGPFGGRGHCDTLRRLKDIQERLFPGIGRDIDALMGMDRPFAYVKAYMRLLAREAELNSLIDPDGEEARSCYDQLDQLETRFSPDADQHDPVVLNGRVARRHLRYLLSEGGIARQREDEIPAATTLARARGLLAVNTSRLRRFSGAERVGVMLDHARVELFQFEEALKSGDEAGAAVHVKSAKAYSDLAHRRAFSGAASQATRLEVLAVHSEACRRFAEMEIDDRLPDVAYTGQALDAAGIAAHDLAKMAAGLRARPSIGLAHYLEAAALIAVHRARGAERTLVGKRHPRPLETARQKLFDARHVMGSIGDRTLDERVARVLAVISRLETA